MKNTFGNSISVTLFGESHGAEIGAVLDGFAPGIAVDEEYIARKLSLRRPAGNISTKRVEPDRFRIVSGVFEGHTTGTPICILIPNENVRSKDYEDTRFLARPGHADFTAFCKYRGYEDHRGGGHFSGRLTAPLVAAGAIAQSALEKKGIRIGTHIARCAGIPDRGFEDFDSDIEMLADSGFAVLDASAGAKILSAMEQAAADGDRKNKALGTPTGNGDIMTREEVLEKIRQVIRDCVPEMAGEELNEDTVINTETAIDSMGFILVICKLEALFDVRIPERQWQKLSTMGDVADAIMKRLPKK